MRKYFGTDGIRRIANTELTPELVYKVAKAGAYVLSKHTDHTPTILIGRDTRISGTLIESAMVAGFLSYGANVKLLGVMPTPAVAYLTKKLKADASVVISASHNTFEFNGVKYFSNKGMKISDEIEEEIEEVMDSGKIDELNAVHNKIGVSENRTDLIDEYVFLFRKIFEDNNRDEETMTTASLSEICSYLKLFHARSKLIIIFTDTEYNQGDKAVLKEALNPFLKHKLLVISGDEPLTGAKLFMDCLR